MHHNQHKQFNFHHICQFVCPSAHTHMSQCTLSINIASQIKKLEKSFNDSAPNFLNIANINKNQLVAWFGNLQVITRKNALK